MKLYPYSEVAKGISKGENQLILSSEAAYAEGKATFEARLIEHDSKVLELEQEVTLLKVEKDALVTNKLALQLVEQKIENLKELHAKKAEAASANLENGMLQLSSRRVTQDSLNKFEEVFTKAVQNAQNKVENTSKYHDLMKEKARLELSDDRDRIDARIAKAEEKLAAATNLRDSMQQVFHQMFDETAPEEPSEEIVK